MNFHTKTFAELEISALAYDEIAGRLETAGCADRYMHNGEILMSDIALVKEAPPADNDVEAIKAARLRELKELWERRPLLSGKRIAEILSDRHGVSMKAYHVYDAAAANREMFPTRQLDAGGWFDGKG